MPRMPRSISISRCIVSFLRVAAEFSMDVMVMESAGTPSDFATAETNEDLKAVATAVLFMICAREMPERTCVTAKLKSVDEPGVGAGLGAALGFIEGLAVGRLLG